MTTDNVAGLRTAITGGTSGLGLALVRELVNRGARVAFVARTRAAVERVSAEHPRAHGIVGDVSKAGEIYPIAVQILGALGGLDLLVNNAGRQQSAESILDISTEAFDWTFKTNVYALFWITRAAVRYMPEGSGIINTASVNSYDPSAHLLDYSMTKAAIANFTKALAKQLAKRGIRVNAVAPGPFWTALQVTGGQTGERLREFGADTPLGRPGQPAEIAPVYVALAANDASYVTGQVYGASGGEGNP